MTILRQQNTADQSVWAESCPDSTYNFIPVLKYSYTGTTMQSGSADCFWRRIVFKYSLSYSIALFYSMCDSIGYELQNL